MSKEISTRERLIAAASRLLDEGGRESVTLRAVAHAVGISHNAPYKHFDSKDALILAVAEQGFQEMRESFEQALATTTSPVEAIKVIVRNHVELAQTAPERYRLLFSDYEVGRAGGQIEQEALRTFDSLVQVVKAAQTCGELIATDSRQLAALIYCAAHGLADLQLTHRLKAGKMPAASELLQFLFLFMEKGIAHADAVRR